ncbi:MAG: hypothetical protein EAZ52_02860 [Alphaproteobacteria bacterium]|nr:MAG: hypothetical protein EAZ52_02860 [Alphaproteobacteria bacterium]
MSRGFYKESLKFVIHALGGNPATPSMSWIPAFAGMTKSESYVEVSINYRKIMCALSNKAFVLMSLVL